MLFFIVLFMIPLNIAAIFNDNTVDCIVFSYDRPLQLEAFLHSMNYYCTGIDNTSVIIRYSNNQYLTAYKLLEKQYFNIDFIYQTTQPNSFYSDTMHQVLKGRSEYIMFAVDDIIVTDYVDCRVCTKLIEETKAHGFFLRLGKEKTYSLIPNLYTQPTLKNIGNSVLSWEFEDAHGDWGCFYSVDMSIFSKLDIITLLKTSSFSSPNTLEYQLHQYPFCLKKKGLCFEQAKIINFSLNIVREGAWGQSANIATNHLLELFNQDQRIDINFFYQYNVSSCHIINTSVMK